MKKTLFYKSILFLIVSGLLIFGVCGCSKKSFFTELGIGSIEDITSCRLLSYNESQGVREIENIKDISFLEHYKFAKKYPKDELHEVFIYPGVSRLIIKHGDKTETLYVFTNGDIVALVEDKGYRIYKATDDNIADFKVIDGLANKSPLVTE